MRHTVVAAALGLVASAGVAQPKLKVHISADMEGVVGTVTSQQSGPEGFEYQQARELMTGEVLAAIEGARAAGATEIVVGDSHGNGQSLLMKELPSDVTLVRSWIRPLGMMEGIDESFDAAIFIGYHTSASNPRGVLAHTYVGEMTDVRINGVPVPEAGLNAAIAGQYRVPVVMISGDDAIVEETRNLLGDVEGAVVKWSYGINAARTLMPEAAYRLIRERVEAALKRIGDFKPYVVQTPVRLEVDLRSNRAAERLAYLSSVERTGARSIRFTGKDMVEVSKFMEFLSVVLSALERE